MVGERLAVRADRYGTDGYVFTVEGKELADRSNLANAAAEVIKGDATAEDAMHRGAGLHLGYAPLFPFPHRRDETRPWRQANHEDRSSNWATPIPP